MRVGIPTETKNNEFRVAITPAGVAELTRRGHEVLIQAGAGEGSAITDADFKAAGAQLVGPSARAANPQRAAASGEVTAASTKPSATCRAASALE